MASKGLRYLPVPKFITAGDHEVDGMKYRFMVMQRFSTDIEKHFRASKRFCEDTVSYLALKLVSIIMPAQYHSRGVRRLKLDKSPLSSPKKKKRLHLGVGYLCKKP